MTRDGQEQVRALHEATEPAEGLLSPSPLWSDMSPDFHKLGICSSKSCRDGEMTVTASAGADGLWEVIRVRECHESDPMVALVAS